MNLTSPNDVKRPSTKNPNLDRIINEIEINFKNEDFTQHTDEFVEMKLPPNNIDMKDVANLYISYGWERINYKRTLMTDVILIRFYY